MSDVMLLVEYTVVYVSLDPRVVDVRGRLFTLIDFQRKQ